MYIIHRSRTAKHTPKGRSKNLGNQINNPDFRFFPHGKKMREKESRSVTSITKGEKKSLFKDDQISLTSFVKFLSNF